MPDTESEEHTFICEANNSPQHCKIHNSKNELSLYPLPLRLGLERLLHRGMWLPLVAKQ